MITRAFVALAAALLILSCSSQETEPDEPRRGIWFSTPEVGAVLNGVREFTLEYGQMANIEHLSFGVDGNLRPLRTFASRFQLDTTRLENGSHTVEAAVRDMEGRTWTARIAVEIDNPDHRLRRYASDRQVYEPGDHVTIALEYTHPGLDITVDFSALDTGFRSSNVDVIDQGEGRYEVHYSISRSNDAADGRHDVVVVASDRNGNPLESTIPLRVRRQPKLPTEVQGAVFIDRPEPDVLVVSSSAPRIEDIDGGSRLLTGNSLQLKARWTQPDGAPAERLIVRAEGHSGYYVMPVSGTEAEVTLALPSLKPGADGDLLTLLFTVVDRSGHAIDWMTHQIHTFLVGSDGVQISLTWNAPVDLDLHVTDPLGNLINFRSDDSIEGALDLDSNASCNIDHINAENISWPAGSEPPGTYAVHVNLYDACGEQDVSYQVAVRACDTEETFSGTIRAGEADPDGIGRKITDFVMDCVQRVHGRVTFDKVDMSGTHAAPAASVPVRAVRVSDGAVLGRLMTDADGRYSMRFANAAAPEYRVEIEASWTDPLTQQTLARVVGLTGSAVYTVQSAAIDGSTTPNHEANVHIGADDDAGAFNILAVTQKGFEWLLAHRRVSPDPLLARWTRGSDTKIESSYYLNGEVFIRGFVDDPDEFDDSVIAHEFMHYVIHQLSVPGPGGPHVGRVAPALAWDEGLATALAQEVLGDPTYRDVHGHGVYTVNIESDVHPLYRGTEDGTMEGKVSEWLIAKVIWDLLDTSNDEAHDRIDRTLGSTLHSIFDYIPAHQSSHRGAPGVDLVEFLDGWRCSAELHTRLMGLPSWDPDLQELLGIEGKDFPYDFPEPPCQ
jgi:hypothetical protein